MNSRSHSPELIFAASFNITPITYFRLYRISHVTPNDFVISELHCSPPSKQRKLYDRGAMKYHINFVFMIEITVLMIHLIIDNIQR